MAENLSLRSPSHLIVRSRLDLFDGDFIAQANARYDRTHPRGYDGMFQEPIHDWMDPVSPDFAKNCSEPQLTAGVWEWINRSKIVLLTDLV